MEALVVFSDGGAHPLSPLLRPGFRHVFVCLRAHNGQWLVLDGAEGVPHFDIAANADTDLAAFYRQEGFTVLQTVRGTAGPRLPFVWSNCVGLAKVALGLHAPLTLTPHGLYRLLLREQRRHTDADNPAGLRAFEPPADSAASGPERDPGSG
jgi:hypothetical protein